MRTYTTLLRSSGETQLRVLEPSHMAMGSSLHPLAASEELDLGAFLYAVRRLPDGIAGAELVVMGQDVEQLSASGIPVESWEEAEAPARRRRWYDSGAGTLAVLLASASDVDDLVPTLVAFQIEWNKIRVRQRGAGWPTAALARRPARGVRAELGGSPEDWARLLEAWGEKFGERMRLIGERRLALRDAHAGRQPHRLLAPDPALVGAGRAPSSRSRASPSARSTSSARTPTAWSTSSPASPASASRSWWPSSRSSPTTTSCARS